MTRRRSTGISHLDTILGGGLQSGLTMFLAGGPGVGKTILAQQISFALGTSEHKALYYTMSSEPHGKLVSHLEQFDFFDPTALGDRVEFLQIEGLLDASPAMGDPAAWDGALERISDEISRNCIEMQPSVIVIDSVKALFEATAGHRFRQFVFSLASRISHTDAVLIMVGEYGQEDPFTDPEFAVADGIIQLANEPSGRLDERWIRVVKMRGNNHLMGRHTLRFGPSGIEIFPRFESVTATSKSSSSSERTPFGIAGLDTMLGGGIPRASSTLIAGPSGAGKTVLSMHFIAEGIARGEPCMFLSFQQTEDQLIERAESFGWDFAGARRDGLLQIRYLEPVEISLDAIGVELREAARDTGISRLVVDSLAEIAPAARGTGRFPDYLSALTSLFRSVGANSVLTSSTSAFFGPDFELPHGLAFVVDNVVILRYVEIQSELRTAVGVMKMRSGSHDKRLVEASITGDGMHIGEAFDGLMGVLGGTPTEQ